MAIELRFFAEDQSSGLRAFVVVDSLVDGRSMGGTRMTATVTPDEVASLARRMTLKLALADLPIGGAKAGIVCDLPPGPQRDRRLAEFGTAVAPLIRGGVYLGSDQGISHRDRDVVFASAGYNVRTDPMGAALPCGWTDLWDRCEEVTGFGVLEAIDEAIPMLGNEGRKCTVAIQGFGAVGRPVAVGLARKGYRVVAVADWQGTISSPDGLPLDALLAATDPLGTVDRAALPPGLRMDTAGDAWLDVHADVLVLAAGGDAIHGDNVGRVQAGLVVEAGNLAVTDAAHKELAARGIPVLPDIVVNCGGAAVTALVLTRSAPPDLTTDGLVAWLHQTISERVRRNTKLIVHEAAATGRAMTELARDLARSRADARGFRDAEPVTVAEPATS